MVRTVWNQTKIFQSLTLLVAAPSVNSFPVTVSVRMNLRVDVEFETYLKTRIDERKDVDWSLNRQRLLCKKNCCTREQKSACSQGFVLGGSEFFLSLNLIDTIIKKCSTLPSVEDLLEMYVARSIAPRVLQIIDTVAPLSPLKDVQNF